MPYLARIHMLQDERFKAAMTSSFLWNAFYRGFLDSVSEEREKQGRPALLEDEDILYVHSLFARSGQYRGIGTAEFYPDFQPVPYVDQDAPATRPVRE